MYICMYKVYRRKNIHIRVKKQHSYKRLLNFEIMKFNQQVLTYTTLLVVSATNFLFNFVFSTTVEMARLFEFIRDINEKKDFRKLAVKVRDK